MPGRRRGMGYGSLRGSGQLTSAALVSDHLEGMVRLVPPAHRRRFDELPVWLWRGLGDQPVETPAVL